MVFGLHKPPSSWGLISNSEKRNAGSIVIRLVYKGKSILFCGDSVGRHNDGPPDQHIAAEKAMVDNSEIITIDSDVIIEPHHGADNESSKKFIEEVAPSTSSLPPGTNTSIPRKPPLNATSPCRASTPRRFSGPTASTRAKAGRNGATAALSPGPIRTTSKS
jgi:hypothetical protein